MNFIRRHIPGSVDAEPALAQFETTEELLRIPWIASWAAMPIFSRFSLSAELLMAELKDGTHWVVGYVRNPAAVNLPPWKK